ncbi:hypothetical protein [Salinibius halmophilus]|uniref:hypothetical protein n=1 Tax=Salinibius halmophilus TaxID=1853216 RepID=UPI000E669AFB|nr:hypothetical protein [Salinibius halmophilus]
MGPWWHFANKLVWSVMAILLVYCLLVIDFNYIYPALAGSVWLIYRLCWRLGWLARDLEQVVPSVLGGVLSVLAFIMVDSGYAPAVLTVFMGLILPRWWLTKVARRNFVLRKKVPFALKDYDQGWVMIESGQPRLDLYLRACVPDVHWRLDRSALANPGWREAFEAMGMPPNKVWPLIARIENGQMQLVWSPEWLFQPPADDVFVNQDRQSS